MFRRNNTGREIVETGEFVKVGRKHYRHGESGADIKYDHNAWVWRTPDGHGFTVLHGAVSWLRSCLRAAAINAAVAERAMHTTH